MVLNTVEYRGISRSAYGHVHQYGAHIAVIRPKTKKVLRFFDVGGAAIFAKEVRDITIPKRPYLFFLQRDIDWMATETGRHLDSVIRKAA